MAMSDCGLAVVGLSVDARAAFGFRLVATLALGFAAALRFAAGFGLAAAFGLAAVLGLLLALAILAFSAAAFVAEACLVFLALGFGAALGLRPALPVRADLTAFLPLFAVFAMIFASDSLRAFRAPRGVLATAPRTFQVFLSSPSPLPCGALPC
jgi:hypothetical protein